MITSLTGLASAEPSARRIVGILDIVGPASDVSAAFENGLEQKLDRKRYWLVPRSKMTERLRNSTKWTPGCLAGPCLKEVKVQTNADVALLAALDGTGTSFGYVVTLMRTDTGSVLSQASDRCDVCTLTEAMSNATVATIRLLEAVPDKLPEAAASPVAAIDDSSTAVVAKQLAASRSQRRHARKIGVSLTVVGVLAAAVGVTAYALQSADDRRSGPNYRLVTAAGGVGLALGGVAVLTF